MQILRKLYRYSRYRGVVSDSASVNEGSEKQTMIAGRFVAGIPMGTSGHLSRNLSWIHSVAVIVGTMVGAGIFVVTGTAAELMGPAVPLGFLVGLPVVFSTALIYAVYMSGPLGEHPGGAYMHISRTWNSTLVGYVFIWLKVVAFIGAQAVFATGFGNAMRY